MSDAPWAEDLEWGTWIKSLNLRTTRAADVLQRWFARGAPLDRIRFQRWYQHWEKLTPDDRNDLRQTVRRLADHEKTLVTWLGKPYTHEDRAGVAALLFTETRGLPRPLRTSETWHQVYALATIVGAVVAVAMGPLSLFWSVDRVRRTVGLPWRMAMQLLRAVWEMLPWRRRGLFLLAAVGYVLLTAVSTWQQASVCCQWWHVGLHVQEVLCADAAIEAGLCGLWEAHPPLRHTRPTWSQRSSDRPSWNWGRSLRRYDELRRSPEIAAPWREALGALEAFVAVAHVMGVDRAQGRPWCPVEWCASTAPICARALHLTGVAPEVQGMDWTEERGAQAVTAITGPNGSGKTMCLLALGWALTFGRALGWAPAAEARLPRWTHLETAVRQATEVGRASLFQTELAFHERALARAAPGVWILLDEPFHSTDRDGAVRCGRWLLEQYAKRGARVVMTTHEPGLLEGARTVCTARPPFALRSGVWRGSVAWEELERRFPDAVTCTKSEEK